MRDEVKRVELQSPSARRNEPFGVFSCRRLEIGVDTAESAACSRHVVDPCAARGDPIAMDREVAAAIREDVREPRGYLRALRSVGRSERPHAKTRERS